MNTKTYTEDTTRRRPPRPGPRVQRNARARRRLTWLEWTAIGLITLAILAVTATSAPGEVEIGDATTTIRVRPSQTLWEIAADCSPDGVSTAVTVEYIRDLNGLSDSSLAAGQVLQVPQEGVSTAMALDWR